MYTHAYRGIKYWFYSCLSLYAHPQALQDYIKRCMNLYIGVGYVKRERCEGPCLWIYIHNVCSHIAMMYFMFVSLYIYIPHMHICESVCMSSLQIYTLNPMYGADTHVYSPISVDKWICKFGGGHPVYTYVLCVCVYREICTQVYGNVYRYISPNIHWETLKGGGNIILHV